MNQIKRLEKNCSYKYYYVYKYLTLATKQF